MPITIPARVPAMNWPSAATAAAAPSVSDQRLVQSAQAGDRAAFGELYQRFARMVHGVLLARVPRAAAEDLVHDVFLHALPKLPALRDPTRFGPWLAAIARNCAADFYRHSNSASSIEDEPNTAESAAASAQPGLALEDGLALLRAVRELPEAYREPLVLRFVEGMTGPEIALRTGLTHGSVRVNLHRGMQLLRQKWESGTVPNPSVRKEKEKQP